MKRTLVKTGILFSLFDTLEASDFQNVLLPYQGYLWLSTGFILLLLLYLSIRYKKQIYRQNTLLAEKDEKIQWLRQIHAESEHRNMIKMQEMEKQIMNLNHQLETLEQKAKEGTKNQVVAKIEELQNKRDTMLERFLSLKEGNSL